MKRLVIVVLLLSVAAIAGEYHRHFHIHQLSLTEFAVHCDNNADPTGKKDGNDLVVSCGK